MVEGERSDRTETARLARVVTSGPLMYRRLSNLRRNVDQAQVRQPALLLCCHDKFSRCRLSSTLSIYTTAFAERAPTEKVERCECSR